MKRCVFLLVTAVLSAGGAVFAQTPEPPPRVIRVFREDVKHGMTAAHAKIEAGWPRAFAKANATNYYVALSSISGANEALFIEPHASYAAIEKVLSETEKNAVLTAELNKLAEEDSAVLNSSRTMIANINEELSRPSPHPFPTMRYVMVTTYRVRPGRGPDFTEFRNLIKSVNESGKTGSYFLVYQVTSGAPAGTYLMLRALKSLAELDPVPDRPTFGQLLGSDNQKKLNELAASALISSETAVFSLSPEMSYVPKEFIAVDAAFWGPKPKPASKSSAKKEAKAAGTQ